ncbi:sulfur carrier protein ThiS [Fontimonas thermophila]|uniref:Sulfur carrier protein ThiS n=1 Tax=Fontimonas thermophila TaxID=1076937 RepID=A0A1I2JA38_9GAMM|nr:sulfur carrier protein ThiS [Fontimonas thermophila]SFF51702.1 sulfur carrier protein ThiS [Fontimonas thermophila]
MQITVNGEIRRYEQPLTLASLLQQLDLAGQRIAVERNGEIVPRSHYAHTLLEDGDTLLIVQAIGGG